MANEAEWRLALRRSFQIPDMVSEENAVDVLGEWACFGLKSILLIDKDRADAGRELVKVTVEMAARGDLDYFLLSEEMRPYLSSKPRYSAAEMVARQAFCDVTDFSTDTGRALINVAHEMVDKLLNFARTIDGTVG